MHSVYNGFYVFFFQAEDGIRDTSVTGVQTCALPIWNHSPSHQAAGIAKDFFGTPSASVDEEIKFRFQPDHRSRRRCTKCAQAKMISVAFCSAVLHLLNPILSRFAAFARSQPRVSQIDVKVIAGLSFFPSEWSNKNSRTKRCNYRAILPNGLRVGEKSVADPIDVCRRATC